MKTMKLLSIILCIVMGLSAAAFSKSKSPVQSPQNTVKSNATIPNVAKGVKGVPGPFRVNSVTFKPMAYEGDTHLVAGLIFNKNIDASSVKENLNIRLLKKNDNHFWVDASTQNNRVRIGPNFISWLCGKPLDNKVYIMHLRGTIKSADGVYLDCNGDGKGEGGSLPAYESKMFQFTFPRIIPEE